MGGYRGKSVHCPAAPPQAKALPNGFGPHSPAGPHSLSPAPLPGPQLRIQALATPPQPYPIPLAGAALYPAAHPLSPAPPRPRPRLCCPARCRRRRVGWGSDLSPRFGIGELSSHNPEIQPQDAQREPEARTGGKGVGVRVKAAPRSSRPHLVILRASRWLGESLRRLRMGE